MKIKLILFLVAVVAVFTLHFDYLSRPFYQDDFHFLEKVQPHSLFDVLRYWSPDFLWFYRPVFLTWFAATRAVFGDNPAAFHAGSLLLHSGAICLLGWLAWRLSQSKVVAIGAALLFLLWPGKSEAIWWISSASTLFCAVFYLTALHVWLSWRESGHLKYLRLSLLCMLLALASKNDAASLPFAFLLIDVYKCVGYRAHGWQRFREATLIGGVLVAFVVTEYLMSVAYALYGDPSVRHIHALTIHDRINGLQIMWTNLFKPINAVLQLSLLSWPFTTLITVGAIGAALWSVRKSEEVRLLLCSAAWAFMATLPVTMASGPHAGAERFNYVPLVPLALSMALLLSLLASQVAKREPAAIMAAGGLVLAAALRFVPRYSDPVTIWCILLGVIGLSLLLWREKLITWRAVVMVGILAAADQLSTFLPWGLARWEIVGVVVCVLVAPRSISVAFALVAYLCTQNPLVLPVLFVVDYFLSPRRIEAAQNQPDKGERHPAQQFDGGNGLSAGRVGNADVGV